MKYCISFVTDRWYPWTLIQIFKVVKWLIWYIWIQQVMYLILNPINYCRSASCVSWTFCIYAQWTHVLYHKELCNEGSIDHCMITVKTMVLKLNSTGRHELEFYSVDIAVDATTFFGFDLNMFWNKHNIPKSQSLNLQSNSFQTIQSIIAIIFYSGVEFHLGWWSLEPEVQQSRFPTKPFWEGIWWKFLNSCFSILGRIIFWNQLFDGCI